MWQPSSHSSTTSTIGFPCSDDLAEACNTSVRVFRSLHIQAVERFPPSDPQPEDHHWVESSLFLTQICAGRESTFPKICSKFSHGEWSSQEKACGCHRIGLRCLLPGINSLGCPLEVLPVQGRGRRVYQLSLGCQATHCGIWEARCFYFEPKCHKQCESKVLCLYLVIIWYFVIPKWHNHLSKVAERCGLSEEM